MLDVFLVGGRFPASLEEVRFNRLLRTVNFCIDLFDDFRKRALSSHQYLLTRQQLINRDHVDKVEVGRYRIPTNQYRYQEIRIQQAGGEEVAVNAVISLEPRRVYAMKAHEVKTLFGRLVKAEIVLSAGQKVNQGYVVTGQKVILKFYNKRQLGQLEKIREDPFKEIVALQYFNGAEGFPRVLDVLENKDTFIKVESDCGSSLFDLVTARIDT